MVSTLEEMEVQTDRLEEKCRIMRRKLADEEEKAPEVHIRDVTIPIGRDANESRFSQGLYQCVSAGELARKSRCSFYSIWPLIMHIKGH